MKFLPKLAWPAVIVVTILSMSGCTVHYVADYDAAIKDDIITVAKAVDRFWGELLDLEPAQRDYAQFKKRYNQIETDLRVLVMKNEIRPLNKESTRQANIALDLWNEDRQLHKQNDSFSDFEALRHRQQFMRVFTAMAKGEDAKNTAVAK